MSSPGYYLHSSLSNDGISIRQHDSDLVIDIFVLDLHGLKGGPEFETDDSKLNFFGTAPGLSLAFQTEIVIIPEETELISDALRWYANEICQPGMDITLSDPREVFGMRKY